MERTWLILGSVSGGLAVAAGAFGAHALKGRVGEGLLRVFETGARYQMYHALALLAVAWVASRRPESRAVSVAGWAFFLGALVFSGSLYALALSGARWWGAVTPVGGVVLLIGWAALAWGAGGQAPGGER